MNSNSQFLISSIITIIILSGCSIKPEIIKQKELESDVLKTIDILTKTVQPVTIPITLDEAIQRAIDHNLNKKIDVLNSTIAEQKIDVVAYEALPSLTTKAGYSERNNYSASQSTTFKDQKPGILTDSYSVSQDKESLTSGVGFSWNVLDFGLSYVRANQQANRYLISKEREKKSIHNIKQEVRSAYYQAVSADELLKKVKPLFVETKKAFEDSKNINKLNLDTPIKSLTYQRELLEIIRSLNTLEENLVKSKIELSKLMGLKPGIEFELAEKIQDNYDLPTIDFNIEYLEKIALENRPELQETRYQEKISQDEIKAVMLQMLPGINFNAGYNYDDNKYLLNNDWMSYGTSISWNLFSLFNGKLNHDVAKTQIELARQQKIALSMAVISQVHISILDYSQAKKEYQLSEEYFKIAKEIFYIIENENSLDVVGNLSLIKEKLNYLISNLRLSSSYAKVQNAYGKIISSVGKEEIFNEKPKAKSKELEKSVVVEKNNLDEIKPKEEVKIEEIKPEIEGIEAYTMSDLNLRDKPTLNSNIIGRVLKDERIIILQDEKLNLHWYKTSNGYLWAEQIKLNKK